MILPSIAIVFAIASGALAAQDSSPKSQRLDVVWQHAESRMSIQSDEWFEAGDFPRVVQLLTIRRELDPHNYETATDLGWMLENIQQHNKALAVYVRYRTENPKDPDAPFPEARYWYAKKEYAKVVTLLEPSIVGKPHPNSFRLLAHSYDKLGNFKDSVRVWETYVKLDPSDLTAVNNLNRVKAKLQPK